MADKPVKVISDLLTRKQIIKQDISGNVLFKVSGTLQEGVVSSSLPITAAAGIYGRLYGTASYAITAGYAENAINEIYTSGNVTGSGLVSNPVTLTDPLILNTLTSSYIYVSGQLTSPGITGNLYGTSSYALTALTASYAENANNALIKVFTSGNVTGSGLIDNPVTLVEPLILTNVTASNIFVSNSITASSYKGILYDTASFALNAESSSFSTTASFALNAAAVPLVLDDLTDVYTPSPSSGSFLKYDGTQWIANPSIINNIIQPSYHQSGTFDGAETIEIQLPLATGSLSAFPPSIIDYVVYNLMIKEEVGSNWKNDLTAVELKVSASHIYAVISVSSPTPYAYNFNAVNQKLEYGYSLNGEAGYGGQAAIANLLQLTASNVIVTNQSLLYTSASFSNVYISTSSVNVDSSSYSVFDIAGAFHAIDDAIGSIVSSPSILNAYKRLRYQYSGTLDNNGESIVALPLTQLSGNAFPISDYNYITVDVMTDENGKWVNDLMAYNLEISASQVYVFIYASASPNTGFRLIAVNENPNDYQII